ncbi:MAG TPA: alanine racemase [Propionicimonas sp.]|jgi:D-serine deaminase-like pyridoxal phosphate-dependent protein|nr:alanine racemase [Propionicimonas sp.]
MGSTPYLHLDVEVMQANIDAMAEHASRHAMTLRPHVKTHKSPAIAELQLAAGARGLTVATIGEAEVFASVCTDLFIAYPLWVDEDAAARLIALGEAGVRLRVGCDSLNAGRNLVGLPVEVLIEIDSGHHRSGVTPETAGDLAAGLAARGLSVLGVFTFPGHSYSPGSGQSAAVDETDALRAAATSLRQAGIDPVVISGGSTPSASFTTEVSTELRPGVYVFGDAQQVELGTIPIDQVALTVVATVVSHAGGRVICDAGSKALAADRAPWASGYGRVLSEPDARVIALSEHHATIAWPGDLPALGSTVRLIPNHACNAVNLADSYQLSNGEVWPITARGRNN